MKKFNFTPSDVKSGQPRFAFVIPAYNHQETVVEVARSCLVWGFPVFVINDGSTDDTPEKLKALEGEAITVLTHSANFGKGAALLTGFTAAAQVADFAITIDADGQHDPQHASQLVSAVKGSQRPLVIGCRQAMDKPSIPWTSRFGRKFSNFWVWASGGAWLSDTQSGYRLYPLYETLQLKTKARRFAFEVEVLVLANRSHIPIQEVPVGVNYQPGNNRVSHFRPFVDFWRNAWTFTRLITTRILCPSSSQSRGSNAEKEIV